MLKRASGSWRSGGFLPSYRILVLLSSRWQFSRTWFTANPTISERFQVERETRNKMAFGVFTEIDTATLGTVCLPALGLRIHGNTVTQIIFVLILGGIVAKVFYNLYLHPLRHYPGPFLARATRAYSLYLNILGIQHTKEKEWHNQYGDIVRCAPNYLSYDSSQAWKDIHGYRASLQGSFDKDPSFFLPTPNGSRHIVRTQSSPPSLDGTKGSSRQRDSC